MSTVVKLARPRPARDWGAMLAWANVALGALAVAIGLGAALQRLDQPPWLDEFNTIVTTLGGYAPSDFFAHAVRGQHPLLYEGVIYIAQLLGVSDPHALRLINLAGAPLVLGAVWAAWRAGVISLGEAAVILALYGSSINTALFTPVVRPYFLMLSGSIVTALAWRALLLDATKTKALWWWAAALAILVNVHYFATIMGGVLTAGLLAHRVWRRRWSEAAAIAGVSLLAAAPALILGLLQASYTTTGGVLYYFPKGLGFALTTLGNALVSMLAANVLVVILAGGGALLAAMRAPTRRAYAPAFGLLACAGAFFALMIAAHLIKPMLWERYLLAATGPVIVAAAAFAAGARTARLAPLAICVFALAAQQAKLGKNPASPGWSGSALEIKAALKACPQARVYAVSYARLFNGPIATTPLNPTEIEAHDYGYRYYAQRYGFTYTPLQPGARVRAEAPCPALIWIEHFAPPADSTAEGLLRNLELAAEGPARWARSGTGAMVTIAPSPAR